jgi:pimeloyl-ACP methyl ester carboxylesterase
MDHTPFQLEIGDGVLNGHYGGTGAPALLLHGGPGLPDMLEGCAEELGNLFTSIRYTQRGTLPSTVGAPYTIEAHMADALAVLDAFELDKAWVVGHSWGGHLALHLATAHPDRFHGIACIGTLGAFDNVLPEFGENMRRNLSDEDRELVSDIDSRGEKGEASEEEQLEALKIVWPNYFADPAAAPPFAVKHFGVECSAESFKSVREHFEAGTLAKGLRKVRMPALFAHGVQDPLPVRASVETAKLIRGARVGRMPNAGHFPWIELPGRLNRMLRGLISEL